MKQSAGLLKRRRDDISVYLSVMTIGELRQGVEKIRDRRDVAQARQLQRVTLVGKKS